MHWILTLTMTLLLVASTALAQPTLTPPVTQGSPTATTEDVVLGACVLLMFAVGAAALGALYLYVVLAPWRIAKQRHHPHADAIGWLGVLFGWSFLGWGIAMIWAHTGPPLAPTRSRPARPPHPPLPARWRATVREPLGGNRLPPTHVYHGPLKAQNRGSPTLPSKERIMAETYRLDIICPWCETVTEVTDWPRTDTSPFAFMCAAAQGGCGGHALVAPRDAGGCPALDVLEVVGTPLTRWQYERATAPGSAPPSERRG
jgi:hypothetical protein